MPGKQVPISEARIGGRVYPWTEWAEELKPGNAFDVTDDIVILCGRSSTRTWGALRTTAARSGLIVFVKKGRMWVGKPAADGVKDV